MGHVCPSGVTPRFSHGLHDCGEQAATDTARLLACSSAAPPAHRHLCRPLSPYHPTPSITRPAPNAAIPPVLPTRSLALRALPNRAWSPLPRIDPFHVRNLPSPSYSGQMSAISNHASSRLLRLRPFHVRHFRRPPLEFWTVLQFLAPVFDTCLEFWAVFPSHRLKKCLRTQATKPLTWGFPIPSTTALAIMASKPPRRFWTPHRSPIRRPPQPASPLRRSPLRCLPLPTSMPTAARTIHTKRDFASISNRRRNLAVHAIRSPATARQTSAALPLSRRYPCKVRSLFLQDPGKGFARRRRQTASKPTHIPDAPTRR